MSDDTGLWERDFVQQNLTGVIDLHRGLAVHAVEGNRLDYAPVPCVHGDPVQLAQAYADFGIRKIYIADLDAIQFESEPSPLVNRIAESLDPEIEFLIDIGWRGNETISIKRSIQALSEKLPRSSWIAAGEAAISTDALAILSEIVPASRMMIGLDYQNNAWMSHRVTEATWLQCGSEHCPRGAVVLDLKSVGSGSGPSTAKRCRMLKHQYPDWQIFSGGGIRDQTDAKVLIDAGCQACLVATAIHPLLSV